MGISIYIVSAIFALFGIGLWLSAFNSRSLSHELGGLCYVGGAIGAVTMHSWWPLAIGFMLTFVIRKTYGDPHRASSATSRSKEYKQLTKLIGEAYFTVDFNSETIERRQKAEDQLFALIEQDTELIKTFKPYGADINRLKEIYYTIIYAGFGQWAKSEWVPFASIATPYTLNYLLKELANEDLNTSDPGEKIQLIVYDVFCYFKKGDPLP